MPGDFRASETGLGLSKLCLPSALLIRQLPSDTLTVQGRVGGSSRGLSATIPACFSLQPLEKACKQLLNQPVDGSALAVALSGSLLLYC